MTDDKTQLTPEEMMERLNQLSTENEKLRTDFDALKKAHDKDSESLQKARELNSELLNRVSVPDAQPKHEPKEETLEDIMKDCFNDVMTKYIQKVSN